MSRVSSADGSIQVFASVDVSRRAVLSRHGFMWDVFTIRLPQKRVTLVRFSVERDAARYAEQCVQDGAR